MHCAVLLRGQCALEIPMSRHYMFTFYVAFLLLRRTELRLLALVCRSEYRVYNISLLCLWRTYRNAKPFQLCALLMDNIEACGDVEIRVKQWDRDIISQNFGSDVALKLLLRFFSLQAFSTANTAYRIGIFCSCAINSLWDSLAQSALAVCRWSRRLCGNALVLLGGRAMAGHVHRKISDR